MEDFEEQHPQQEPSAHFRTSELFLAITRDLHIVPNEEYCWDWGLYLAKSSAHDDGVENVD